MKRKKFISTAYGIFFIAIAVFYSCTKTEQMTDEKLLTLPKSIEYKDGIPVYFSQIQVKLNKSNINYFIEIVSDEEYQSQKDKIKFQRGRLYPNLDYPLTHQTLSRCFTDSFTLPYEDLRKTQDSKYWIRAIHFKVPVDVDQMQEPSAFDRLLAVAGRLVDRMFGFFEYPYLNARNYQIYIHVTFGSYHLFWIKGKEPYNSKKSEQEFKKYSNEKWGFSFKLPSSWDIFTDENFFIKVLQAPSGIPSKETLQEMINSLDKEYPKHYQGFKKISAQLIEKAGGVGVGCPNRL